MRSKTAKMVTLGLFSLALGFSLFVQAPAAQAATYTSNIEARVKLYNHRIVPGALVCVYDSCGRLVAWKKSSSRGVAKFTGIPSGTYRVMAWKLGAGAGEARAVIQRGQGPARPTIRLR